MLLQVRQLAEGVLAVGAVVGLDAQVDAQVLGQVRGIGEGLGAVGTLVGLGLCVGLGVDLHLRLGEEGERAHLTPGVWGGAQTLGPIPFLPLTPSKQGGGVRGRNGIGPKVEEIRRG